jgi:hypothetical protein
LERTNGFGWLGNADLPRSKPNAPAGTIRQNDWSCYKNSQIDTCENFGEPKSMDKLDILPAPIFAFSGREFEPGEHKHR